MISDKDLLAVISAQRQSVRTESQQSTVTGRKSYAVVVSQYELCGRVLSHIQAVLLPK